MNRQEWYISKQGNTETIQTLLQKIQYLENGNHFAELANSYYSLGKMYHQITYYPQAINAFHTSLHNFQRIKEDGREVGFVRLQLARAYSKTHAREKAIEQLTLCLSLFQNDPRCIIQEIDAYNQLGVSYKVLGDWSQARQYYQMAICKTIAQKLDHINLMVNLLEDNHDDTIKCCLSVRKIRNSSELSERLINIYFVSRRYKEGLTEILKGCDKLLLNGEEYIDFRDKMFERVLTAMKVVKDKAGRELIENILARHYKEQDLLLDYIRSKLGREKKLVNLIEQLD